VSAIQSEDELKSWSKLDKDISLRSNNLPMHDSIYTTYRITGRHHRRQRDPYREISGTIEVNGKLYNLIISSSLVESEDLLGSILTVQIALVILLMGGFLWINRSLSKKNLETILYGTQQYATV